MGPCCCERLRNDLLNKKREFALARAPAWVCSCHQLVRVLVDSNKSQAAIQTILVVRVSECGGTMANINHPSPPFPFALPPVDGLLKSIAQIYRCG